MASSSESGEVITFYSYKGGTGRSMALANTACLLARRQLNGKGVLMVDWDLEAPGLHRYFRDRFQRRFPDTADRDAAIDEMPGLIDLFGELDSTLANRLSGSPKDVEEVSKSSIGELDLQQFILATDIPSLYLLKAGRFDDSYSSRVNAFRWEEFFQRSPTAILLFAERLMNEYDYVLVDSRTGLTDISGICTTLMPEKLVVVFTPNRQSLTGVLNLVRRAALYRRESEDLRPLIVFPLPSRFEPARPTLRDSWRFGNIQQQIPGYQPQFESLLAEIYDLDSCRLGPYLDEVQIQHVPDYAYGEEIAVLIERSRDSYSLTRAFENFENWLVESTGPWEERQPDEGRTSVEDLARTAEALFARLTPSQQEIAQHVLTDMVHLSALNGGENRRKVLEADLDESAKSILPTLIDAGLVVNTENNGERLYELVSEGLINGWPRLKGWLAADREFLLWRQRLQERRFDWERTHRDRDSLLRGALLAEAKDWLTKRGDEINNRDREFVLASRRRWGLTETIISAGFCIVLIVLSLVWLQVKRNDDAEMSRQLLSQAQAHTKDQPDLALLLAVEASRASNSLETRTMLEGLLGGNPRLTGIISLGDNGIKKLAMSANGRLLASVNRDGNVALWDFSAKKIIQKTEFKADEVLDISFSPDGKLISVVSPESITLFSANPLKLVSTLEISVNGSRHAVFSPDSRRIAVVSGNEVIIWNAENFSRESYKTERISQPVFDRRGRLLLVSATRVVGFSSSSLDVKNTEDGTTKQIPLKWLCNIIRDIGVVGYGGIVAVQCLEEGGIVDLDSGNSVSQALSEETVAVSGDGRVIIDRDNVGFSIRDARTGKSLGRPVEVLSVLFAISKDGYEIAFANEKVIGLINRRMQSDEVNSVRACQVASRNFSQKEWRLYFDGVPYRKSCSDFPEGP